MGVYDDTTIGAYEAESGRKVAGLRGDTRERLDYLLTHELMGTGIGRSALILTMLDLIRKLPQNEFDDLVEDAKAYEREFSRG